MSAERGSANATLGSEARCIFTYHYYLLTVNGHILESPGIGAATGRAASHPVNVVLDGIAFGGLNMQGQDFRDLVACGVGVVGRVGCDVDHRGRPGGVLGRVAVREVDLKVLNGILAH